MEDPRPVIYFDIDNTLYPKSKKIYSLMGELIEEYFMSHLSLSQEDATELHLRYYKEYGLAIEGLVRFHKVDPLEYNSRVDDALPLDEIIHPDPELRRLLEDFDRDRVRLWLFTNAYITHGRRVVKLLKVDDLFEGITYCDYASTEFICKPSEKMFAKAQRDAGVSSAAGCWIIEDSALNCKAAKDLGWTTVHLVEPQDEPPQPPAGHHLIRSLHDLRSVFPHFFKHGSTDYN